MCERRGGAIADDLGVDRRARAGVIERLEHEDARSVPMTKPSRSASNGRDAVGGSSVRFVESARMALKAATGISPMPASAPTHDHHVGIARNGG